jgi:integrase
MARKASGQVLERKRKGGRRIYALRFSAYGSRQYLTLVSTEEGWNRSRAEQELENVLADVRRGIWHPPEPELPESDEPKREPTFHQFASEWYESRRGEWSGRTPEDYKWALTHHLLPFFSSHRLSEVSVEEVDRYRTTKVREGRLGANCINKTLTRLGQIMEVAVEYGYVDRNPVRVGRRRCRPTRPRRASMGAAQVAALLEAAGSGRALLATALMGGGLRVSEVTGLRWRDVDLARLSHGCQI